LEGNRKKLMYHSWSRGRIVLAEGKKIKSSGLSILHKPFVHELAGVVPDHGEIGHKLSYTGKKRKKHFSFSGSWGKGNSKKKAVYFDMKGKRPADNALGLGENTLGGGGSGEGGLLV